MRPLLQRKSKKYYYIFWVCVCSLRYPTWQCACDILSSAASPVQIFFYINSLTAWFSEKKKLLNIKCVLIFSTISSGTCLILRKIERGIIKIVYRSPCKVPAILVTFNETLIFRDRFFEKHSNVTFHENSSIWEGSCSMRTDGRTDVQADMTKLTFACRSFPNAPKRPKYLRKN